MKHDIYVSEKLGDNNKYELSILFVLALYHNYALLGSQLLENNHFLSIFSILML